MEAKILKRLVLVILVTVFCVPLRAQTSPTLGPANLPQRDGSHDFDFLIGEWKAHVRRLPDRLNNSNTWVEYDGISNHHKILDSNSNFEEFDVTSTDKKLRIKAQTLRLYNPTTRQWSIYLLDVNEGTIEKAHVTGSFSGNRGELYGEDQYKGRAILVRYVWLNIIPRPHAWSSRSRGMAARPGRSTGFVSCRDSEKPRSRPKEDLE